MEPPASSEPEIFLSITQHNINSSNIVPKSNLEQKPLQALLQDPTLFKEPQKRPNLFLSSDEEKADQFAAPNISESDKSNKKAKLPEPLLVCDEHRSPIKYFCGAHIDYLCETCRKDHLGHQNVLEEFGLEELRKRLLTLEEHFSKVKTVIIEHQKALKAIVDNEKNKSDDISETLHGIYHFLSRPILKPVRSLRGRKSRSLKKSVEQPKLEKPKPQESIEKSQPVHVFISKSAPRPKMEVIPKSVLIADKEDRQFIKFLMEPHLRKNEVLELIYRASRDGFKASDFHRICDDKPRTLIIIQSNFGNIFGGFSKHSWKSPSQGQIVADPDAFLFSLTYHTKHKQIKNNEFALYLHKNYGPVFGKGYDLCLREEFNRKSSNNFSRLGNSFLAPAEMELEDNYSYLAGSESFSVKEMEVFQINEEE